MAKRNLIESVISGWLWRCARSLFWVDAIGHWWRSSEGTLAWFDVCCIAKRRRHNSNTLCSRLKSLALNPKICPDNGWLSFWRDQLLAFCSRHWINRFLPGGGLAVSCSRARILNANTVEYCAHSFVTAAIKIPSIAQPRAPLCGTYQTSRCRPPAASGRCRTGWARGELC